MSDRKRGGPAYGGVDQLKEEKIREAIEHIWKPSPYIELLRNRDFLLLWLGQGISQLGDWLIVVALVLLVRDLTGSALAVGTLMIFKILPVLLFGSVVGVFVDRLNRKRTMIFCDLFRGVLVALLPFVRGVFQVYLIVFLMETFSLFFMPAKDASLPNLVEGDHILTANSLSYTTNQLTMILGLGFGSTIILVVHRLVQAIPTAVLGAISEVPLIRYFVPQLAGSQAIFVVDTFSFIVSAILIGFIHLPPAEHLIRRINYSQVKDDVLEGLHFLKTHPRIRPMIISAGMALLGGGSIYTLGVFYCEEILRVGKTGFGFLLTLLAVGMLLGGIFSGLVGRLLSRHYLFNGSILILGVALLLFSLIPYYGVTILLSVVAGVALGLIFVSGYTFLHETVENKLMGRVFATLESLLRVSLLLSLVLTGLIADIIGRRVLSLGDFSLHLNGPRITLVLGALVVMLAGVYAFRSDKLAPPSAGQAGEI